MRPIEIHRAWAPTDGTWSPWVKPVLFAAINEDSETAVMPPAPGWLPGTIDAISTPGLYREQRSLHDTAIVIDLPSDEGTKLGVALTEHGFRPIPLYNALPSRVGIIDVLPVMLVLLDGAEHVAKVPVSAPPAFLLDADRMGRGRSVRAGLFDNRSLCGASDFPSCDRFREAGIRRVLLITDELEEDLEPIALEWQAAGLALWWKRPAHASPAAPVTLRAPWLGSRLWNALFRRTFHRNADGAYGAMLVVPSGG